MINNNNKEDNTKEQIDVAGFKPQTCKKYGVRFCWLLSLWSSLVLGSIKSVMRKYYYQTDSYDAGQRVEKNSQPEINKNDNCRK